MSETAESGEPLPALPPLRPPRGARFHALEVGDETLLVISYPVEPSDPLEGSSLSTAEREVARLAIQGLSNAEVAERRGTSVRTIANQMASIFRKLDLSSRRELAARYARAS